MPPRNGEREEALAECLSEGALDYREPEASRTYQCQSAEATYNLGLRPFPKEVQDTNDSILGSPLVADPKCRNTHAISLQYWNGLHKLHQSDLVSADTHS